MTDKQIIIDGIVVSWCNFFRNGICASPINPKCKLCVEISEKMCYYKQLKRKEQEYNKLYIQLKADEEYHKEEENTLRKIIKNKEERNIELYKENNKLKQTLIEIKEVMKKYCRKCKKHKFYNFKLCCTCKYTEILQKISECEVENDR